MSTYAVHKFLKRVRTDAAYRAQLVQDGDAALSEFAFTTEERHALVNGEVGRLHAMGVHGYLLNALARYQVFGLTAEQYTERIHAPAYPLNTGRSAP